MGSLVTKMFVLEMYGPLLGVRQLAKISGLEEGTVRNQISDQTFPIPTSKRGKDRVAHYADVADYIDSFKPNEVAARNQS